MIDVPLLATCFIFAIRRTRLPKRDHEKVNGDNFMRGMFCSELRRALLEFYPSLDYKIRLAIIQTQRWRKPLVLDTYWRFSLTPDEFTAIHRSISAAVNHEEEASLPTTARANDLLTAAKLCVSRGEIIVKDIEALAKTAEEI